MVKITCWLLFPALNAGMRRLGRLGVMKGLPSIYPVLLPDVKDTK